jgi:hypothetical protein
MRPLIEHLESLMQDAKSLRHNIGHPVKYITVELNTLLQLGNTLVENYEKVILPLADKFQLVQLIALSEEFA